MQKNIWNVKTSKNVVILQRLCIGFMNIGDMKKRLMITYYWMLDQP